MVPDSNHIGLAQIYQRSRLWKTADSPLKQSFEKLLEHLGPCAESLAENRSRSRIVYSRTILRSAQYQEAGLDGQSLPIYASGLFSSMVPGVEE